MPYFEENIIFQRNDFLFYKIIDTHMAYAYFSLTLQLYDKMNKT